MSIFPPPYWYNKLFRSTYSTLDTYFFLFRYILSKNELDFIRNKRIVFSTNRYGTYWTTLLTDDPKVAMQRLALPNQPIARVGGVPLATVDNILIRYQGRVLPNHGQPGGARDIVLRGPVIITSLYDFNTNSFIQI